MNTTAGACPECGSLDAAQRVTAIVRAGTPTDYGIVTATPLAQQLNVALLPVRLPKAVQSKVAGGIILAVLIGPFVVGTALSPFIGPTLELIGIGRVILASIPLFIWGAYVQFARKEKYIESLRPIWAQLYYCHRCDRVFLPGDERTVPPGMLLPLLEALSDQHHLEPKH
jgi:hypothetical protein